MITAEEIQAYYDNPTHTAADCRSFFLKVSAQAFAAIHKSCRKAVVICERIISGIRRFFKAPKPARHKPTAAMIWLNTTKASQSTADLLRRVKDEIGMEETLREAMEILIDKKL